MSDDENTGLGRFIVPAHAMTLRDYFAGQALNGAIARDGLKAGRSQDTLVRDCYLMADAMLRMREAMR